METTQTYIATRTHPTLGELVKVGKSIDVKKRTQSLGCSKTLIITLPRRAESDLKRLLAPSRVWKDEPGYRWREHWRQPVFSSPSEWFYYTPAVQDLLKAYIRFQKKWGAW